MKLFLDNKLDQDHKNYNEVIHSGPLFFNALK